MLMALTDKLLREELLSASEGFRWLQVQLRQRLGLDVNLSKTHFLLPPEPRLAEGERANELVKALFGPDVVPTDCIGGSPTAEEVLRVTGVPVGNKQRIREAVVKALRSPATEALAREIARSTDTHMAYTLLRLCLIPRASFLARNLGLSDVSSELQRFDAISMCAFAAVAQEPSAMDVSAGEENRIRSAPPRCDWEAALASIHSPGWQGSAPVALSEVAQVQASLALSLGGLGIRSVAAHKAPAFLARSAAALPPALRAFPASIKALLREGLHKLPFVADLQAAYGDLLKREVAPKKVLEVLPAGWELMLTTGDCAAVWEAVDREGGGLPIAAAAAPAGVQPDALANGDGGQEDRQDGDQPANKDRALSPVLRPQAALSKLLDQARLAAIMAVVATPQGHQGSAAAQATLARLRSQQGRGAMAAFSGFPSNSRRFAMTSSLLRESLRRNVGIERPAIEGSRCCNSCTVQQSGAHARACSKSGEQNYRHATVRDALIECIKTDAGLIASRESVECFDLTRLAARVQAAGNGKTPAMDIVISPGSRMDMPPPRDRHDQVVALPAARVKNKGAAIDVSIVDPTCQSHRRKAADTLGHAASTRVKEKFIHYCDTGLLNRTSFTLIPFVLEQFGNMSPHANDFIQAVAAHQSKSSGEGWPQSRCTQRWRQRLSIALQEGISASVARCWTRTGAAEGGANLI